MSNINAIKAAASRSSVTPQGLSGAKAINLRRGLFNPILGRHKEDVLACLCTLNRFRRYSKLVSCNLDMALLRDTGPCLIPGRCVGHSEGIAFNLIRATCRRERIEQGYTIGIGDRTGGGFPVVPGEGEHHMASLCIDDLARRILSVWVIDLACLHFFVG